MSAQRFEDAFDEGVCYDDLAALATFRPARDVLPVVARLDLLRLSRAGQVDALVAMRRIKTWAGAQEHRLVADMAAHPELSADPFDRTGKEWVREEIATALSIDPDSARGVIVESVALVEQFPATLGLLEQGEISPRHASALVEATAVLEPELAAKVEERVIGRAPAQTVTNFRRSLKRAVHAIDPRTAEEKHRRSRADRSVWNRPQDDGMSTLGAFLPAEDAAVIETACDTYADQLRRLNPADPRTKAQLRADALTHFALNYLNGANSGSCARRPAVQITISLETLVGLNDQPAELDGYGPITAAVARHIAADPSATLKRLITDPAGKLLDYKQTTYKPPKPVDEHIKARDRRCRFPRCKRRAKRCDIDHLHDWHHGGRTCVTNLECLCERHHQLKHETAWTLTGNPESTLTWTSPTGHTYTSDPPPQPTAQPPPDGGEDEEDPPPF